jgi:16S rRNA (cytidine1402-2'-O)-methyltransferase
MGTLTVVATPIGNLEDVSPRALAALREADLVLAEDTRRTRVLLDRHGIAARPVSLHAHNEAARTARALAALAEGRAVALVSDAGTPLVSDPGFKLVRACLAEGYRVESVPGPSAVLAALSSSGLPTDAFLFAGFLPPRSAARRARIAELAAVPATLILFEAPSRVAASLADLAARLGADRPGALARELTKLHEEVRRGSLGELAAAAAENAPKGEVVLLVGPPHRPEASDEAILDRLSTALATLSLRDAAQAVAEAMGVSRSRVYDVGLRLRRERE